MTGLIVAKFQVQDSIGDGTRLVLLVALCIGAALLLKFIERRAFRRQRFYLDALGYSVGGAAVLAAVLFGAVALMGEESVFGRSVSHGAGTDVLFYLGYAVWTSWFAFSVGWVLYRLFLRPMPRVS